MLQHLQGYQNHNVNSAVGLLFSNSLHLYGASQKNNTGQQVTGGKSQKSWLVGGDGTRGLSPCTDHNNTNSLMMLKRISSPIVDYNNNNMLLDRSEIRKSLLEGYQNNSSLRNQQNQSHMQAESATSKFRSEHVQGKANINKLQTQTNSNQTNHTRVLSKETVSSYVHQVKRPQTNVGYHTNY